MWQLSTSHLLNTQWLERHQIHTMTSTFQKEWAGVPVAALWQEQVGWRDCLPSIGNEAVHHLWAFKNDNKLRKSQDAFSHQTQADVNGVGDKYSSHPTQMAPPFCLCTLWWSRQASIAFWNPAAMTPEAQSALGSVPLCCQGVFLSTAGRMSQWLRWKAPRFLNCATWSRWLYLFEPSCLHL